MALTMNIQASGERTPSVSFEEIGNKVALTGCRFAEVETEFEGKKTNNLVITGTVDKAKAKRSQIGEDGTPIKTTDNRGRKVNVLVDAAPGEEVTVWLKATSSQAGVVLGAAEKATGKPALEDGASVTVSLVEYKDTGKASPMKVFAATYEAPVKSTTVAVDGDDW